MKGSLELADLVIVSALDLPAEDRRAIVIAIQESLDDESVGPRVSGALPVRSKSAKELFYHHFGPATEAVENAIARARSQNRQSSIVNRQSFPALVVVILACVAFTAAWNPAIWPAIVWVFRAVRGW